MPSRSTPYRQGRAVGPALGGVHQQDHRPGGRPAHGPPAARTPGAAEWDVAGAEVFVLPGTSGANRRHD